MYSYPEIFTGLLIGLNNTLSPFNILISPVLEIKSPGLFFPGLVYFGSYKLIYLHINNGNAIRQARRSSMNGLRIIILVALYIPAMALNFSFANNEGNISYLFKRCQYLVSAVNLVAE
jgi:hypothetical protein